MTAVTPENRTFDPAHLTRVLDGRYATVREDIRTVMRRPEFAPVVALPTAEYRERVLRCSKALAAPGFPERYGGRCGGAGYMSVNRFAALRADTDIFTTFEGDNTVLMMLLAKGLLTDYADHFGELNPVGTVTFVAGQAVETVIERLFARQIAQVIGDFVSGGDDDDLLAPDDQLALFRWREGHMTAAAAQRFKRGLDDGHEPFEVFGAVQNHAVNVARAHMATVLLEAFQRAVTGCEDEELRSVLKLLCDLYALEDLEADRAFFMEHGRLSGPRCKALTREVNRLCNEARLCAGRLVDAFGIPDEVLAAPIGLSDRAEAM